MPASAGTVDASSKQGLQEPGGASRRRLSGILKQFEKTDIAEIIACKCIAPRNDAGSIALDANPIALVINSPLQSHRAPVPWFSELFRPFRCSVTSYQNQKLRILPRGRPRPVLPSAAQQPSDAGSNEPETHLVDETFGGEECAAENCEPANNTSHIGRRNSFSRRERAGRSSKCMTRSARLKGAPATA